MNQNDQTSKPTPLDYAGPATRRGNPVLGTIVGLMGFCAGLLGALVLFWGIPGIVDVFTHSNTRDFPRDLFELVIFLLIGAACIYLSLRWCRAVRGIFTGR